MGQLRLSQRNAMAEAVLSKHFHLIAQEQPLDPDIVLKRPCADHPIMIRQLQFFLLPVIVRQPAVHDVFFINSSYLLCPVTQIFSLKLPVDVYKRQALTILLFVTKGESLISLYLTDTSGSGATGAALQYGSQYLIIMMAGLIPFAVNQAYATNIKETGQTLIPMIASFVAVGSNAILDYLLIFGIGPFPELGVQGAALATVIARYIEALMIIIWAHRHREKNRYLKGAYTGFGIPADELKAIIIKGLPLMMNEVLWAAGMTAVIQCYSIRGLEVVAGLNIRCV